MHRGVRQSELADLIGYEQTYISALEIGKKGPPTPDFIRRLIIALDLSVDERNCLLEAADASQRKFIIDNDMPPEVFWLFRDLRESVSDLTSTQIQIIRQVLSLNDSSDSVCAEPSRRLKRRRKEEATM